jgi:hypothetical protein
MATTTNYGWTTPDDTALVKDGAAAIRTLGTSVDTTTKNLNPSTTLGDIEYRSSTANTNTRLGIGSTGNVLTVAGGVPTWAAPAGGGGKNFSLLNSGGTTLSGSTTTISGISSKDDLLIVIKDAAGFTTGTSVSVQVNSVTTNYFGAGNTIIANAAYDENQFNGFAATNLTGIFLGSSSTSGTSGLDGSVMIRGCNTTGLKIFSGWGSGTAAAGDSVEQRWIQGSVVEAATISSIVVVAGGGSFSGGTVYVYGAE